ncbi:hypothetical protein AB832_07660 [Flavobacteriaceae bacterium (ex Bugula neritina AB1)]|nr:hypothetical protein AB832_07660 [Flavobacteriaceae bacterium (ex Bugula neritina AB1)]
MNKDDIIKLVLANLGKDLINDPMEEKDKSIIKIYYNLLKREAIINTRPDFALTYISLQKSATKDDEYLLPKDFLLKDSATVNGRILLNNIYKVNTKTNLNINMTYFADVDESYYTPTFVKYLALSIAVDIAHIYERTESSVANLILRRDEAYTNLRSANAVHNEYLSNFITFY